MAAIEETYNKMQDYLNKVTLYAFECAVCGYYSPIIKLPINFCPKCGRKVKEHET